MKSDKLRLTEEITNTCGRIRFISLFNSFYSSVFNNLLFTTECCNLTFKIFILYLCEYLFGYNLFMSFIYLIKSFQRVKKI